MKFVQSLGVAALLSLPLTAEAAVTLNIDSITGVWTDANGAPETTAGIGTNTLSWGTPADMQPSSYVFDPVATPINGILPNTVFDLGKFTHNNFPIFLPSITDATLEVTIMGTAQNGSIEPLSLTSVFIFNHLETPNELPCDPMGATICPDVVTAVLNVGASESFEIDGVEYVLSVTGFNGMTQFITEEGQMNMATLQASFVERSTVIPLPASLPLLLGAIGGLSLLSRRRRA